jgi:hypothetical protein
MILLALFGRSQNRRQPEQDFSGRIRLFEPQPRNRVWSRDRKANSD